MDPTAISGPSLSCWPAGAKSQPGSATETGKGCARYVASPFYQAVGSENTLPSARPGAAGPDGQPCTLIMLLASPVDRTGPHIQALARISRLWLSTSFREAVAEAETPAALRAAIERYQE